MSETRPKYCGHQSHAINCVCKWQAPQDGGTDLRARLAEVEKERDRMREGLERFVDPSFPYGEGACRIAKAALTQPEEGKP
jgi:hypothetical protein